MGAACKLYRTLTLPLPYNQDVRALRLDNILRLHNYRVRTTGISQIKNTFNV